MAPRTGYTPCDWPDCNHTIMDGWALFRVNPTGQRGIFMCSEHAGASPEEVADLMDAVAGAMANPDRPQCVIEVGHQTLSADASWLMDGDPEKPICDRHKGYYETAYDDYSDIVWVPIEGAYSGRSTSE